MVKITIYVQGLFQHMSEIVEHHVENDAQEWMLKYGKVVYETPGAHWADAEWTDGSGNFNSMRYLPRQGWFSLD